MTCFWGHTWQAWNTFQRGELVLGKPTPWSDEPTTDTIVGFYEYQDVPVYFVENPNCGKLKHRDA